MLHKWHVLRTAPRRELLVAGRLEAAGHTVEVPLARTWRARWLRRDVRRGGEGLAPICASYAFLRSPVSDWPAVLHLDDVVGVLMSDGAPAVVLDAELSELRRQGERPAIRAGQRLTVVAGAMTGHQVSVLAVGKGDVRAAVEMLGARRPVRISVDMLAAA